MSGHTPGPWRVFNPGIEGIAEIWDTTVKRDGDNPWLAIVSTQDGYSEANASLIAAAPELLDALNEIVVNMATNDEHGYCSVGCGTYRRHEDWCPLMVARKLLASLA